MLTAADGVFASKKPASRDWAVSIEQCWNHHVANLEGEGTGIQKDLTIPVQMQLD